MFTQSQKWLVVAVCIIGGFTTAQSAYGGQIDWRKQAQSAQQEAQASDRPMMVYVTADFCGYCRVLERNTWSHDSVAGIIERNYVPLYLDGQSNRELAQRLDVRGYPAVIVLSPTGKILGRVDGYRDPTAMHAFLRKHSHHRDALREAPETIVR